MSGNQFFGTAFSLAFVPDGTPAGEQGWKLGDVAALPVAKITPGWRMQPDERVFAVTGEEWKLVAADSTAYSATYGLLRPADGAQATVHVSGRAVKPAKVAAGSSVYTHFLRTGVVLAVNGEPIAFVPNALGRAALRTAQSPA